MTDDKTQHGQWPLPHPGNKLSEDVTRLREALVMADAATKALQTAMAAANAAIGTKAAADHGHGVATPSANGFMAAGDKGKLDGIQAGANAYSHPSSHPPGIIAQDANNRFFTDAERQKLSGIQAGATATAPYSHPAQHAPSVIAQDPQNRFVTDAEKAAWNGKMGVGAFGLGGAAQSVNNFNAVSTTGFYMGSAATGAPNATGWWMVENIVHDINWMVQTAWGFAGNEGQVVTRVKSGGTWTNWSGNMAGGIKSVQRGVSTLSQGVFTLNVTLSPVNLSKSFVTTSFSYSVYAHSAKCVLTSSTNLKIDGLANDGASSSFVAWEVVEFF
jgi:hypothetical protein